MLRILLKSGTPIDYRKKDFTSYQWKPEAFIVLKGTQWIGIYNWDSVKLIEYIDYPDEV